MKRHIYHYCAANGSNQLAGIAQLTFKIISQQDIHKFMGELEKIGFKAEAITSLSYLGKEGECADHADSKAVVQELLQERSKLGMDIDAAIRDGVVPEQHPLRSRLEMLANHRQREQELRAEVERVNNQINEMPGMDAFDEIDRLRAECGNWEMALGTVLATIPAKEVIRATGTVGDAVAYFKQLHQQRDKLMAALQDVRGALSSVNSGHQHQITVNDEPAYWQTGEWVRWILDEVLPVVDAAINTTKAE